VSAIVALILGLAFGYYARRAQAVGIALITVAAYAVLLEQALRDRGGDDEIDELADSCGLEPLTEGAP
jgi:hypothetical protein